MRRSRFKNSSADHLHTCAARCQFYHCVTLTCVYHSVRSGDLSTQRGRGNVWHTQQECSLTYIKPNPLWTNYRGKKRVLCELCTSSGTWRLCNFMGFGHVKVLVLICLNFVAVRLTVKNTTGITQYPSRTCLCMYFWTTHCKGDEQLKKNNPSNTRLTSFAHYHVFKTPDEVLEQRNVLMLDSSYLV